MEAAADQPPDAAAELSALETTLRQPDAVLEPGVLGVLRRYVAAGGHPATVVELLSDNYVGLAASASLVVGWDALLDGGKDGGGGGGDAPKAAADAMTAPAPSAAGAAGAAAADAPTAADYLRALAAARFDPAAFAGVFTRGGGGPPAWLDALVADRGGRALVYSLSAHHDNCLLLSYAVRRALRAGHADEVAAAGAALAGHCSVFATLAAASLARVPAAPAATLVPLAADLAADLCRAQHAYVTAQAMLARLGAAGEGGGRFRRLAQELEAAAAAAHGAPVWQMARWVLPPDAGPGADAAAAAVAVLAGEPPGSEAAGGAVRELASMFRARAAAAGDAAWGREGGGDPAASPPPVPPLAVLRQPILFERLLGRLFTPGRAAAAAGATDDDAAALLATAAAAVDGRPASPLDAADVPGAAAAIAGARSLALSAAGGARFDGAAAAAAANAARVGAAAAGVLHTARAGLRGAGNARPDAARALADVLVALIVGPDDAADGEGSATVVVDGVAAAARWADAADPSLLRHFLRRLLAAVAPPYSPLFAGTVVRLLAVSGVRPRARGGGGGGGPGGGTGGAVARDGPDADTLRSFADAVAGVAFDPPLSAREAGLLAELRAGRVF